MNACDFFFSSDCVPLHKVSSDKGRISKDLEERYSLLISTSQNVKEPSSCQALFEMYNSKMCRVCMRVLSSSSNFFYHTLSTKHQRKVIPYVTKEDLEFWEAMMTNCQPILNIPRKTANNVKKKIPQNIPNKILQNVPKNIPVNVPKKILQNVPKNISLIKKPLKSPPFYRINSAQITRLDDEFVVDKLDYIVQYVSANFEKVINLPRVIKAASMILNEHCRICSPIERIENIQHFVLHTFSSAHLSNARAVCNISFDDLIYWYQCLNMNENNLIEEYRKNKSLATASKTSMKEVNSAGCLNTETPLLFENSNNLVELSDDVVEEEMMQLRQLFRYVDGSKLNRYPLSSFYCQYCKVEWTSTYECVEHIVSRIHTVFLGGYGLNPSRIDFRHWKDILINNLK